MAMVTRKDIEVVQLNGKEVNYKVGYEMLDHVNYNLSMYQNTGDNMRKFAIRTTGNRLTVLIDLDNTTVNLPIYTSIHKATEAARDIYRNELRHREAAKGESSGISPIGTLIPNESFFERLKRSCKGPKHTLIVYKSNKRDAFKIVHKNALYPSAVVVYKSFTYCDGMIELEMGCNKWVVPVDKMFNSIKNLYCHIHGISPDDVEIIRPAVDK